jgi:hypothetical protein
VREAAAADAGYDAPEEEEEEEGQHAGDDGDDDDDSQPPRGGSAARGGGQWLAPRQASPRPTVDPAREKRNSQRSATRLGGGGRAREPQSVVSTPS